MKKLFGIFAICAMCALAASQAFSAFNGPGGEQTGGFKGPGAAVDQITVEKAKNLPDDSIVSLTGNIVSKFPGTDDKYMFKDATGEIRVDIDDKYFRGREVRPANTVRITGEVDKDFGKAVEIDVKQLEILN